MKESNKKNNKFNRAAVFLILIMLVFMFTSCLKYMPEEEKEGIKVEPVIAEEQEIKEEPVEIEEAEVLEEDAEAEEEQDEELVVEEEQIPVRTSEVEFYFFL